MADQADKLRDLASQIKSGQGGETAKSLPKPQAGFPAKRARVIAVASGKGGVGKSNLSVNLALAFRKLGKEVLLFDADLGLANADVLLGMSPRYNLLHFMQGQKPLAEVLAEGPLGIQVVPSGNGVSQLADLGPQERERMLSHFSLIEDRFDVVLVDTGAGISRNVISFASAADECLVVTTPEPTARLDAYGLIKTLNADGYAGHCRLIVNMAEDEKEGGEMGELMGNLAKRFLNFHVEYLGYVPRDKAVLKSVSKQQPFSLAFPDSAASRQVALIAAKLMGEAPKRQSGFRAFLERMGASLKKPQPKSEEQDA